jgi:hypothetical protein
VTHERTHTGPTTFEGGCHCKRVRFRVRLAPDRKLEAIDCNCSICRMKGFLHLIVTKEEFELLSGEGDLTTYTFNTGVAKHTFCRVCGMHAFYTPRSHPDGVDVNVRCLDGRAIREFSVVPFDGDNWEDNVETIR